jgi:hypothetical protein
MSLAIALLSHTRFRVPKCFCLTARWLAMLLPAQDVKPGKARVIKCLIENMAQPNFGEECKSELQERERAMQSDWRCVVDLCEIR